MTITLKENQYTYKVKKDFSKPRLRDFMFKIEYLSKKYCSKKIYFKIDQHLVRYFVYYGSCLLNPNSLLCSQIITSFLNSIISTNQEKGFEY